MEEGDTALTRSDIRRIFGTGLVESSKGPVQSVDFLEQPVRDEGVSPYVEVLPLCAVARYVVACTTLPSILQSRKQTELT